MSTTARPGRTVADFALIGDCESAALVGRDGAIEWLCWPAFGSDSCFAALLGGTENGAWRMVPLSQPKRITRRYVSETLVLETRFECEEGVVSVLDFMPIRTGAPHLIRLVRGHSGRVRMRCDVSLRFGHGRLRPWLRREEDHLCAVAGPDGVLIRGEGPWRTSGGDCTSEFEVPEGRELAFSLSYFPSHAEPPDQPDGAALLEDTIDWWRTWARRCRYQGPWREAVVRSLLTLKALTYRPTGGLVAAPTSSLPEKPGGFRNWDYRYCWLRDATFTLMCLLQTGYREEAAAWRDWLLRAAAGAPEDLQPVYTLSGRRRLTEWEADWLAGFQGARPVRFGNAAANQRQLDTFGEVVDALYQAERNGVAMTPAEATLQAELVEHTARTWSEPDHGMWEVRGRPQRFTHSQAMAWVALDRGVKSGEQRPGTAPLERWRRVRDEIHAVVMAKGFDAELGAFTQALGSKVLDASVLLLPQVGFIAADDPRMISTVEALEKGLMRDGFLRRYPAEDTDDGVAGDEGAFLACNFWLAEVLAMQGRRARAEDLFDRLMRLRNDVGLLSEEYDPKAEMLTGNFPQALSHLALVNAALTLSGWGPSLERSDRRPASDGQGAGPAGGRSQTSRIHEGGSRGSGKRPAG